VSHGCPFAVVHKSIGKKLKREKEGGQIDQIFYPCLYLVLKTQRKNTRAFRRGHEGKGRRILGAFFSRHGFIPQPDRGGFRYRPPGGNLTTGTGEAE